MQRDEGLFFSVYVDDIKLYAYFMRCLVGSARSCADTAMWAKVAMSLSVILCARVFIAVCDPICAVQACMECQPETSWTLSTNARNLSYRLKVSESADLPTCESVSPCTGYKPNNAWSGPKHLRLHGYVSKPLWMLWTEPRREW